jgi:hypothetical protein
VKCASTTGQFVVGEATACHVAHELLKSSLIVFVLAVVVPESPFVDVAKEMKGFDEDVSCTQRTLQKGPEILDSVCMNLPLTYASA